MISKPEEGGADLFFHHAPGPLCELDPGGRMLRANAAFCEALGYDSDELCGAEVRAMLHPEDREVALDLSGAPPGGLGFVRCFASKAGAPTWLSWALRARPGEGGAVACVVHEVSQHRRNEGRFAAMLEALPDAVALSREGRLLYVNRALSRDLGYQRPAELDDKALLDIVHPDDRASFPVAAPPAPGPSPEAERPKLRRFLRRDGTVLTAEVALVPFEFDGARALLLVARDVTGQQQMQARLLQAERMASLGTLAAGIAHEINNPLTYLTLNFTLLGRELDTLGRALSQPSAGWEGMAPNPRIEHFELRACAERATEALRVSREGAERVALIVRDLRLFSRAEDQFRGPIDVRKVLDSAVSLIWNEIRHRGRLVKEYAEVELVEANEAQLGQVFLNLLLNAAQALPDGGGTGHEIRVSVRQAPGHRVQMEVRDTGCGIAPEIVGRVFDPFFTTRPAGLHTGLGLSICHGIVTGLGGQISLESTPNQGTLVRVQLPSHEALPAVAHESLPPGSPRARAPRVRALVIDDEPLVAAALEKTLEPDAEVISVTSGRDAIDLLLRDQRFDVILCDLMMPDIAGMDVYEAVRRARPGVEERFVLMTGGAFTHRAREFLKAVPNRCLDKPIDPDDIRRLVLESRGRRPL